MIDGACYFYSMCATTYREKEKGKKRGLRNDEEKTLVPRLAGSPSAPRNHRERKREKERQAEREEREGVPRSDLSRFYFYCTRPREGDDLSIFL